MDFDPFLAVAKPSAARPRFKSSRTADARLGIRLAKRQSSSAASGQQKASMHIADYLRDIAEAVVSSLSVAGETELQFVSDPGCSLPPKEALSLGLIVGELVTNAVKYAHPTGVAGKVMVSCRRASGGNITIEISDDGVGLPEGVDPIKNDDFGFRLVRSLADQLGATIAFHSDCLGLRFVLHMLAAMPAQFP
jgi:two-component sensor histidine kinase